MNYFYVPVDGTHGTRRSDDWIAPDSEWTRMMADTGWYPLNQEYPYGWDTNLDGVFGKNHTWIAAGRSLFYYIVPPLCPEARIRPADTYIISFSHGTQVALYAFRSGLKGTLISVNPPIRNEMLDVARIARPNILRWINIYGDNRDIWALLGGLRDGHFGVRREFPMADENILVKGGHGAALRDSERFGIWRDILAKVTHEGKAA